MVQLTHYSTTYTTGAPSNIEFSAYSQPNKESFLQNKHDYRFFTYSNFNQFHSMCLFLYLLKMSNLIFQEV